MTVRTSRVRHFHQRAIEFLTKLDDKETNNQKHNKEESRATFTN